MSTTQHHPTGTQPVIDLARAREHKVQALLDRRDELGQRWAHALSHSLPNAEDLAYEIAVVEEAIAKLHPPTFDAMFSSWVVRDASRIHEPGSVPGSCSMCDAAHGGAA